MINDEAIAQFVARERPSSWYARHYTELRNAIITTMAVGCRYDQEMAKAKATELTLRKLEIKQELLPLTGGVKLWSETKHRSPKLIELLTKQRSLKEQYEAIPKSDKASRKAFKPQLDEAKRRTSDCRNSGAASIVEIGTGLSDDKICAYLYESLRLSSIKKRRKGSGKSTVTADDIALKKLRIKYPQHLQLFQLIIEHRKCNKLISYLNPDILDKDGRIRCMYKPFGTQSGRLSSSANPFGTGTNLQNFDGSLKTLLIPDEG